MESTGFPNEALKEIRVRQVERSEEVRYQELMARHHYLGALAKIGETITVRTVIPGNLTSRAGPSDGPRHGARSGWARTARDPSHSEPQTDYFSLPF
jgi:hypothetical protein